MKHHIITSADGSHTLKLEDFDECYHSNNGAYNESVHIYIGCGVEFLSADNYLNIYDIGLGTALNCLTTLIWQQQKLHRGEDAPTIHFNGIEKYPIEPVEALSLNFPEHIYNQSIDCPFELQTIKEWWDKIHNSIWESEVEITKGFFLTKHNGDITHVESDYFSNNKFPNCKSVIYYDTFSPSTQPQLWDVEIFKRIYCGINTGSVLLTYCSKGIVKQALRDAGFKLERLQGPPGKRHIIRAVKQ